MAEKLAKQKKAAVVAPEVSSGKRKARVLCDVLIGEHVYRGGEVAAFDKDDLTAYAGALDSNADAVAHAESEASK